ncbi:helix-turn-helix transcriptional regulator [Leptotrichia sp. oral taxon 223]|uniref:helix-turn-helix domain-containing protein n=1 Tax=Leptotrichia sp. oral taxon 223 TaxID=712363 RepID=UPI0015B8E0B7|nr:helix-turn-helix transcriptional regulator [Leptotrichia sp. oral taxon 223]NWO18672.1 helix-turn-helix transcriptional regulator [Leptotrichia sp. oral taxon 223]
MNLRAKRMAYNVLKLKIKDKKMNYQKLAKELRISESGLNKKINGKNYFTQSEIYRIKELLELTDNELIKIFF